MVNRYFGGGFLKMSLTENYIKMNTTALKLKQAARKGIRLDKYLKAYHGNGNPQQKEEVISKFTNVWGKNMANHFLMKYDNAESLINALDMDNLVLFMEHF